MVSFWFEERRPSQVSWCWRQDMDIEKALATAFILPQRRSRYLSLLESRGGRDKWRRQLAHFPHWDSRFIHQIEKADAITILDRLRDAGAPERCYAFSELLNLMPTKWTSARDWQLASARAWEQPCLAFREGWLSTKRKARTSGLSYSGDHLKRSTTGRSTSATRCAAMHGGKSICYISI